MPAQVRSGQHSANQPRTNRHGRIAFVSPFIMQAPKHLFVFANTRAGRGYIGGLRTTAACGGDKGVKKLGRNLVLRKQREAQSLSSNPARACLREQTRNALPLCGVSLLHFLWPHKESGPPEACESMFDLFQPSFFLCQTDDIIG